MSKLRRSILGKLLVIVLPVVILFFAGISAFILNRAGSEMYGLINANSLELIRSETRGINDWIESVGHQVQQMASTDEIRSMDRARQRSYLAESVERSAYFEDILVIEPDGMASTTVTGDRLDVADREYFAAAMAGLVHFTPEPMVSRISGDVVFVIAVPVLGEDRSIQGVLAATIPLAAVVDKFRDLSLGLGSYPFLIDPTTRVIYHPDESMVMTSYINQNESARLREASASMVSGQDGVVRYDFQGQERLTAYAPIPITQWGLAISVDAGEIDRPIQRLTSQALWITAVIVLFVSGLLTLVMRHFLKPLGGLMTLMQKAEGGDLTVSSLDNGLLKRCWEVRECGQEDCPAYKNDDLRCWQIPATLCDGEVQGDMIAKFEKCSNCKVVQAAAGDEIGQIALYFDNMVQNLRIMVGKTKEIALLVTDTSGALAASTEETSASIEQVASTTNEFASSIDSMTDGAQQMSESAATISNTASDGFTAVKQAVRQTKTLQSDIDGLAEQVSSLGENSQKIGNIVNVVMGIAEQTNLLALNAAIEAARAGELGRGFAVVADEVRQLAERSSRATKEIADLVNAIQKATDETTARMESSSKQTGETVKEVAHSGEMLSGILEHVTSITEQIKGFTTVTRDIQSGSQQISASTEEQSATIEEVAASAEKLNEMAQDLQGLVSNFTV